LTHITDFICCLQDSIALYQTVRNWDTPNSTGGTTDDTSQNDHLIWLPYVPKDPPLKEYETLPIRNKIKGESVFRSRFEQAAEISLKLAWLMLKALRVLAPRRWQVRVQPRILVQRDYPLPD
jgi:hypothetical protein